MEVLHVLEGYGVSFGDRYGIDDLTGKNEEFVADVGPSLDIIEVFHHFGGEIMKEDLFFVGIHFEREIDSGFVIGKEDVPDDLGDEFVGIFYANGGDVFVFDDAEEGELETVDGDEIVFVVEEGEFTAELLDASDLVGLGIGEEAGDDEVGISEVFMFGEVAWVEAVPQRVTMKVIFIADLFEFFFGGVKDIDPGELKAFIGPIGDRHSAAVYYKIMQKTGPMLFFGNLASYRRL
jgi:hypothetical protein